MSKFLRIALPACLVGVLCVGLGTTSALATCEAGAPIFQGGGNAFSGFTSFGTLDLVSCTPDPYRVFWAVGEGNPAVGFGKDSGASAPGPIDYNPLPDGYQYASDWGNSGVDGCIIDPPAADPTPNMAVLFNGGRFEGTPAHKGTMVLVSINHDEIYQQYNIDQVQPVPGPLSCAELNAPFWNGVNAGVPALPAAAEANDCGINADATNCPRSLISGALLYTTSAPCTRGPLSGDVAGWTAAGPAAFGIFTPLADPGAPAGQCSFAAYGVAMDSGFSTNFLSAHSGPVGGTGNADGDAYTDLVDTCPNTASANNADGDGDGVGDVCDNCPGNANSDQADEDSDNIGDVCDICGGGTSDADFDLLCSDVDNCPSVYNPGQDNGDGDGFGDACDVCPTDPINDDDNDGICGGSDNCPNDANASQANQDGDTQGDVCDACASEFVNDVDNDTVCGCDVPFQNANSCQAGKAPKAVGKIDNCQFVPNTTQVVSGRGDGLGTACEDKFRANQARVLPTHDQGFGDCRVRFQTTNEYNCPDFKVVYRGAAGDRDTGLSFNCIKCSDNTGVSNTFYGGSAGAYIAKCHGGHNIIVQAVRTAGENCAGRITANRVAAVKIEIRTIRFRP